MPVSRLSLNRKTTGSGECLIRWNWGKIRKIDCWRACVIGSIGASESLNPSFLLGEVPMDISYLLQSMLYMIPIAVVCLIGIVKAGNSMSFMRTASSRCQIGCVLILINELKSPLITTYALSLESDNMSRIFMVNSILSLILEVVGVAFLIAAVFSHKKTSVAK